MVSSYQPLIFVIIIVAIGVIRFRKNVAGGMVSKNKIIIATAFYFVISALTIFSSFQIGVSQWFLFAYAGALAGSTYLSSKLVRKKILVWESDDGSIHARGGNISYIIWLGGLVLRLVIGYFFIGSDYLQGIYVTHKILSASAVGMIMIVDLIMMIGIGAMTGRNMQVLSRMKKLQAESEKSKQV